jgi:hypothetical protein
MMLLLATYLPFYFLSSLPYHLFSFPPFFPSPSFPLVERMYWGELKLRNFKSRELKLVKEVRNFALFLPFQFFVLHVPPQGTKVLAFVMLFLDCCCEESNSL